MPVKYMVLKSGRLVIERWAGMIHLGELFEHEKQQLNDESIARSARVLADIRQAQFPEMSSSLLRDFLELHENPENKASFSKCALFSTTANWSLGEAFEAQANVQGRLSVISCNSLSVACAWLGIDETETIAQMEAIDV